MRYPVLVAHLVLMAGLGAVEAGTADAAYFTIEDRLGQITATAGDFELGITLAGSTATGLGNGVTVIAAAVAGPLTFSGQWIDVGQSVRGSFAQISADAQLVYSVFTDGTFGTISGAFCAAPTSCTIPIDAVVSSVGDGPNDFSQAFLSASWRVVQSVPEPSGIVLLGAGIIGLGWVAQRRG